MVKKYTASLAIILSILLGVAVLALFFPYNPVQSPKVTDDNWSSQGVQKVADATNQFALSLYSELNDHVKGNLFYSPYSIFSAMAMVYEGARGTTAQQIQNVFYFPQNISLLRANFARIYNQINGLNSQYTLRTGNALWVQKSFPLLSQFVSIIKKYYGGKAANLDFVNEPSKSADIINQFIEQQTNNKIKDLISPNAINSNTRLIITNAIYFKGKWKWKFDKSDTHLSDFKITPSKKVKVPMMHMYPEHKEFNYAINYYVQILELPYRGDSISMIIVLPKTNLSSLGNITLADLDSWMKQMRKTTLSEIAIPKFEFNTQYYLDDDLKSLGMPLAFTPSADLSGMDGRKDLMIDKVIHKAYIKVDEEGTEAAAATSISVGLTAAPIHEESFIADHPFLFFIVDKENHVILFMGKVVDPRE